VSRPLTEMLPMLREAISKLPDDHPLIVATMKQLKEAIIEKFKKEGKELPTWFK